CIMCWFLPCSPLFPYTTLFRSQGIGFAVPIDIVRSVLPQLERTGRVVRGYLGVSIQDLTPELAEALGLSIERGALVASVAPDGPDRKSTRLNSSHVKISYAVFC